MLHTHLEPWSRKQACLGFFQIRFRLKTFQEILNSRYPSIFFGWFLSCPKMRQKFAIVTPKSCLPNVLWIDFQQLCKKETYRRESIKPPLCVLKFSSWIFTEFCFFKKSTSCVQCVPWFFSTESAWFWHVCKMKNLAKNFMEKDCLCNLCKSLNLFDTPLFFN